MPTEDQFVSVPLNSGLTLKQDDFVDEPPGLSESKNVDNESRVGAAKHLPEMFDLTDTGADTDQLALIPGNDTIAMLKRDSHPIVYNKSGDAWAASLITTAATSSDVIGDFIITDLAPIDDIAHGKTDTYDVYAWTLADPDGGERLVGRYMVRAEEANIGPFNIPVQNPALFGFLSIALTRGTTECYLYVLEIAAGGDNVFGYQVEVDGTLTLSSTQVLPNGSFGALDVSENTPADPNRRHWVAVAQNSGVFIHDVTAHVGVTVLDPATGGITSGIGIAIDFSGTNVAVLATKAAASGGGAVSVHFDPTDFAGTVVASQSGSIDFAHCVLRWTRDGWIGACDSRKGDNTVLVDVRESTRIYLIDDTTGVLDDQLPALSGMRLAGDGHIDEDGGFIIPLCFTNSNTQAPTETNLVRGTWPVDPAIVGYLVDLEPFTVDQLFGVHPVARWGTDRVRTRWGRSKISMPYAADPTTPEQTYGRSLLDVRLQQRKSSATAVLSNGGTLVGTSLTQLFDGRNFMPACHLWRPVIAGSVASAGGSTPAGVYVWRAVFIWEDDTGLLIRSADSEPLTLTMTTDQQIQINVDCHQPPHQDDVVRQRIRCWIYATEDGGPNFYLITDASGSPQEGDYSLSSNLFIFHVDNAAGNPENPLLTFQATPPEVTPQAPNGFLDVETAHNRVWGIDSEDRNRVWFSKRMGRFGAPEFNGAFVGDFPEEDGELTALGVLNANPVFFKKHTIWVIQGGEGPGNVVGLGRGYAIPVKVAHQGAINRLGVVSFPGGVVFHTGRSLMLLSSGLQVNPFGQEIQPETLGGVIDSSHVSGRRELHFNFEGSKGRRHFVYNYDVQLWSEWPDVDFIDEMVTVDSRVFLLEGTAGECLQLKEGGNDPDFGVVRPVPDQEIRTSFIRPSDRNAARRVRELIFEFKKTDPPASGTLTVVVDEEHANLSQTFTWTAAEIAAAYPAFTPQRVILRAVPIEQFESVSVKFTVPHGLNLEPVSCGVLFGIEQGVQRRYPEGSSK